MSHNYHSDLPNYVPEAVFQDDCPTCEARAALGLEATSTLDPERLRQLWKRAGRAYDSGFTYAGVELPDGYEHFVTSRCEAALYPAIQAMQRMLERYADLTDHPEVQLMPAWLADTRGRS